MRIAITGTGVISPIGIGMQDFRESLKLGSANFSLVQLEHQDNAFNYPGAIIESTDIKKRIDQLDLKEELKKQAKRLRNLSTGAWHGIFAALEAWINAGFFIDCPNPESVAIVSSGSNTQQSTLLKAHERYRGKLPYLSPAYGFNFLDSDIIGILSELLNIKGEGHLVGAASASGNMAIIQGARLISNGEYDVVLVVAPSMELSIYEFQGFTMLGAMAVVKEDGKVETICNPFDKSHSGFVYGQNAGAIILESERHAKKRAAKIHSYLTGYGTSMDGNRNPNPSVEGEARAMQNGLDMAGLNIQDIDYINTHGTASPLGDKTEVEAILSIGGRGIKANATKGLIGHGITSAGLVEAIASIVQMDGGFLHPNPNLVDPISNGLTWMQEKTISTTLRSCLSNSFGFGGINTTIILQQQ